MCVLAEIWKLLEKFETLSYGRFMKGRRKIRKYEENPGGLVVYVIIDWCFEENSNRN